MNFIACIGTLMVDTGLKTILSRTFGSVDRMLEAKKDPQNLCALRLLTEEQPEQFLKSMVFPKYKKCSLRCPS